MKRALAVAGLGAVVALGSLAGTGTANASDPELSYLQMLNYGGFYITDTASALATGYNICEQLDYNTGDIVSEYVFMHSSWAEISTREGASMVVLTSVEQLCPWHDHRGRGSLA
jgi:Protein of unknown function (DUF732)